MKPTNVFWHIYGRDQIKPPLQGDLVYVIEVPCRIGSPVIRHVFDPTGRHFSTDYPHRIRTAFRRRNHGIVYQGVSKAAAYGVLLVESGIATDDQRFIRYNQEVISNSRLYFLVKPEIGMQSMPEPVGQLLCGTLVTPGDFHLQI